MRKTMAYLGMIPFLTASWSLADVAAANGLYVYQDLQAGDPSKCYTEPQGINDRDHVAGAFCDPRNYSLYGYFFDGVTYQIFYGPPTGIGFEQVTTLTSSDDVLGLYLFGNPLYPPKTFTYTPATGKFHRPVLPGNATGMNAARVIVGTSNITATLGYMRAGNVLTTINPPGSSETVVAGINNAGTIAGTYRGADSLNHGFTYTAGVYTTFSPPPQDIGISVHGIDAAGDVFGTIYDRLGTGIQHGFTYIGGVFTQIDFPGAVSTNVIGIGAGGQALGVYSTSGNYLDTPLAFNFVAGSYYAIPFPGTPYAKITSVNSNGDFVGVYEVVSGQTIQSHPFIATCKPAQRPCLH